MMQNDGVAAHAPPLCGPDGLSPASGSQAKPAAANAVWPEVDWDEDGYPVAEADNFSAWNDLPFNLPAAAAFLLRELPQAAQHCCAWCETKDANDDLFGDRPVKRIEFSTGGWSGAESLIGLVERRFDTAHFMLSWRRGGHYVFEIPECFFRDSDGSAKRRGAASGSTEGDSAGPKDIAQPEPGSAS